MYRDIIDNVFGPRFSQRVTHALAAGICSLLIAPATWAASLSISDAPLFLSSGVRPNVFLQLDDSGSMDWEILTTKHWSYCDYDPTSRIDTYTFDGDTCDGTIRSNGLWQSHTQLGGSTGGSTEVFEYIYVNSDASYSQNCSSSRETMYACNGTLTSNIPYLNDWRILSSNFNVLYYDPNETYIPWLGPCTGDTATPTPAVPCANASFTAARSNPRNGSAGYTVTRNLDGFAWEVSLDNRGFNTTDGRPLRGSRMNATNGANGMVDLWDDHVRYQINGNQIDVTTTTYAPVQTGAAAFPPATSGLNPTVTTSVMTEDPCKATMAIYNPANPMSCIDQVKQNVANWYQYARKRQYVAKAGISAVVDQVASFRYGLDTINQTSGFVQVPTGLGSYAAHNDSVLDTLYSFAWPAQGTPLRQGLQRAGDYFDKDGANNLGRTNPIEYSCQKNFSVLLTDGYWNGNSPGLGDIDSDGVNNTVADVARNYYDHDLDTSMANDVEPDDFDPETYQHLVTYTLAFGVEGQLVDGTDAAVTDPVTGKPVFGTGPGWPSPLLTESGNWGNPTCTNGTCNQDKVDDLWHAAYNSRGTFISAATPGSVVAGLQAAIKNAQDRTGSASSVALNSGVVNTNTRIYQARFIDTDWRGELLAIPVLTSPGSEGVPDLANAVDAGVNIQLPANRVMMTHDGTGGVLFEWSGSSALSAPQQAILNTDASGNTDTLGPDRLAWLRGDQSLETTNGGTFRNRPNSLLADIINSAPVFVGKPEARYPDVWTGGALAPENCGGCESYTTFKTGKAGRTPMVYAGTNGGTLNGFNADFTASPVEKLAYVPAKVFPKLTQLMDQGYTHNYYVDGSPTVVDAFFGSAAGGDDKWHTVLAGGLNKGGQGIYALDITNPASFAATATSAQNTVLWEFTDANDPDLGFSYSRPAIVRMHNGQWAAVFGNGYNNRDADGNQSTTGHAVLFIVDIQTGSLIRKIDTEAGSTVTPNGLATPAVVDVNGDFTAEYVYAGDLQGNLWKFDVNDVDPANWDVSFRDVSNVPEPLYIAKDSGGTRQPITVRPDVGRGPDGIGAMIYFGTGIYLQSTDLADTSSQTFYGLLDNGNQLTGRATSDLAPQTVILQSSKVFKPGDPAIDFRVTSDNAVGSRGWLMDLPDTGERSVSVPILRAGRIIFVTITPDANVCKSGGTSWLMELEALTGSRLPESPFDFDNNGDFVSEYVTVVVNYDVNNDGVVDSNDTLNVPVSGKGFGALVPTPGVLANVDTEFKYTPNSVGGLELTRENPGPTAVGRQSWGQLR